MKSRIVVTTRLPGDPLALLNDNPVGKEAEITHLDEARTASREELLAAVPGAHAILCQIPDRIDDEVLDAAGDSLRIVANYGVGFDNIDIESARARGVIVTNTPGVVAEATADVAWLLMLMAARETRFAQDDAHRGTWDGWHPMAYIGKDLLDKTLLIVGMGAIGQAVARRALGWRMQILYKSRTRKPEVEKAPLNAEWTELDEGLERADFVSLHCPHDKKETHHLIDARRLALMKRDAILINTARGPIVDENALVEALDDGTIHAAGLDVYEHEPKIHPGLRAHPRAILLPHIGTATTKTRVEMTQLAVKNLLAVLSDQTPPNRVV